MQNSSGAADDLLTLKQVADRLQVCVKTVRRLIRKKNVPIARVGGQGGQIRIPLQHLAQFLDKECPAGFPGIPPLATTHHAQLARLRAARKKMEASFHELVEKGRMEAEAAALRERLVALKLQRDEIGKEIGDLQRRLAPAISSEKFAKVARDKLRNGLAEIQQAYVRLLVDEVRVSDGEIRVSCPKAARRTSRDRGELRLRFSLLFESDAARAVGRPPKSDLTANFNHWTSEK